MPSNPKNTPRLMMKMSYIMVSLCMVLCRSMRWKTAGQMNERKHPVKLPMKPMRIVKWGMTTAKRMVTITTATRNSRP